MSIFKRITRSLVTLIILWSAAVYAVQPLEISHVYVDEGIILDGEQHSTIVFTVMGSNFLNGGTVELLLGEVPLRLLTQSDKTITAALPENMETVPEGSYQLLATTGGGTVRQDEHDGVTIGAAGLPGPQGEPGVDGTNGADGATGPKGDTGDQGEEGPQGPVGPPGPKGDTGDQGERGPQGDLGDIAACADGFAIRDVFSDGSVTCEPLINPTTEGNVTIASTSGQIVITAGGSRIIVAPDGTVTIEGNTVNINSTGDLNLSGNDVNITGTTVDINGLAGVNMTGTTVDINGLATVDIDGSVITLN